MRVQRFRVQITADPRGHAVVAVPFDPDKAWGAKAVHHVAGTVNGCRVRVTLAPGDSGWAFTLNPSRMRGTGAEVGSDAAVELAPEGPQRGDLADDLAAALAATPAAGAFFDTLAQFYRRAYLRYIDATTRRPDLRAARIAEVVSLLADGIKERPRSSADSPAARTDLADRSASRTNHCSARSAKRHCQRNNARRSRRPKMNGNRVRPSGQAVHDLGGKTRSVGRYPPRS